MDLLFASTRDGRYEAFVRELQQQNKAKVIQYDELLQQAQGRRIIILGGYVDLDKEALELGLPAEVHHGPSFAPNSAFTQAKLAEFPDTIVDGTASLRARAKEFESLGLVEESCPIELEREGRAALESRGL